MPLLSWNVTGIVLATIAAIMIAMNDKLRNHVTAYTMTIGLGGLLAAVWGTAGRMAFLHCEKYKQLCGIKQGFEDIFGPSLHREDIFVTAFIAGGTAGVSAILLMIIAGIPKDSNYRTIPSLGFVLLVTSMLMLIYGQVAQ